MRDVSNFLSGRKNKLVSGIVTIFALVLFSFYSFAGDQTFFGPKQYNLPKGSSSVNTESFTGCSVARQVTLKVTNGSTSYNRIKSGSIILNGTTVASNTDFGSLASYFEKTVTINNSNTIKTTLNSSNPWFADMFTLYKTKGTNLLSQMSDAELLETKVFLAGIFNTSEDLETLLAKFQNIQSTTVDYDNTLISLISGLSAGCSYDCDAILNLLWNDTHILALGTKKSGLVIFRSNCLTLKGHYDAVPSSSRNADYYRKVNALTSMISLLNTLDGELASTIGHVHDLDENEESCQTKTPFVIVEIKGNCDSTAPTISSPQPADGAVTNNNKPVISAQYADESQGTGINTSSVQLFLDGNNVTSGSTVSSATVSYTPSSSLSDGQHTVIVNVSDNSGNASSITWHFTIETTVPVVNITSPVNNLYLNTPTITVTGTVSETVQTVTVNGVAAQMTGTTFSLSGVVLAAGVNNINVAATDQAGNTGTASIVVNLDVTAPLIQIISPANSSNIKTPVITVTGTISETVQTLTINGVAAQITGTNFTFSGVSLVEGLNIITVEAKDLAGNTGTATVAVTLDTILPTVQITSPVNNSYTNISSVTVTGTVNETVQAVTVNGVAAQITGTNFTLSGVALVNGANNISVNATDFAGNTGNATISVNLDTEAPVVLITNPANSSNVNTPVITVTGTVSEAVQSVTINGVAAQVMDRAFSLSGVTLADGLNTINVEAKDLAGNIGTSTATVTLDTTLPVVQVVSPVNNSYLNTPVITVTGTVSESAISVKVNGINAQITGTNYALAGVSLAEGANSITVEATDLAGNTGTTSVIVNLDTAAPVIQVASPIMNSYVNTQIITVTGTINETVTSVTVNGTQAQVTGTNYTLTGISLAEGANSFTIEATDLAGNKGTASVTVNLDTAAPVVQISSPVANSYVNTPNITVSGTVSETVTSVTVNGTHAQVTGTNFSLAGVSLAEGANTFTVEAIDLAGNTGTANVVVNLDTAAPVVQVTSQTNNSYVSTGAVTIAGTVSENVQSVTVNGIAAQLNGTSYSLDGVSLAEGVNTVTVETRDFAGNTGSFVIYINLDTSMPSVQITSPVNNSYLNTPVITVVGTVSENVKIVTVNGTTAQVTDKSFTLDLTLVNGLNNIIVEARDFADNAGTASVVVNLDTAAPIIQITSPANSSNINTPVITVTGTVSEDVQTVNVNGVAAQVTDRTFTLGNVALANGTNNITVQATDLAGNTGTATVAVTLDTTLPVVQVASPVNNSYVNTPVIIVAGTVSENMQSITVNGVAAQITDKSFALDNVTLANGINNIVVEATDLAGNKGIAVVTVTLDTAAPVIQITSPANTSNINTANITVTGTVNEPVQSVTVNGVAAQVMDKAFTISGVALADGMNSIVVEATDLAGNKGTSSVSVTLDTTLPVVQITSQVNNAWLNTPVIAVAGTVSEAVQSVTVNGVAAQVTGTSYTAAGVPLSEGSNSITVQATDLAGNVGSSSIIINLDTVKPAIQILSPADNSYLNTQTITLTGSVDETVTSVKINSADAQVTNTSFTLTGITLSEGANTMTVEATDLAGNKGTAAITVNLDTAAPVVQINYPVMDSYVNTPAITVTGGLSEAVQSVTVNGTPAQVSGTSFSLDGVSLADGANTITVEATDLAGNKGTTSATVYLDTTVPVSQITSQVDNTYINTSGITITGTLSEAVQSVIINGVAAQVNGTSYTAAGVPLTEGANTITVQTTDLAGNVGTSSIVINLDTTSPVAQVTSPSNNSYVNTPVITLTGSANEVVQSVTVNGAAAQVTGNSFTLAGVSLAEGPNTINIEAKDLAGNTGTSSTVVNLDTVLPVVQITSPANNVYLNTPSITVTGTVSETGTSVTVNGQVAQVTDTAFAISGVSLTEGVNTITAEVKDRAGNVATTSITVNLDTVVPVVQVTLPVANTYTNAQVIAVTGTVSKPVVSVTVNGNAAAVNGTQFQLASITLNEGQNTISVQATDQAGNIGIQNITLILDTIPPVILVTSPANNSYISTATTAITGTVSELNPAGFWINDTAVPTSGGNFSLAGFSLVAGANNITFKATDVAGNESTETVTVNYDSAAPVVSITTPKSGAIVNTTQIDVTGILSKPVASVSISGAAAQITNTSFGLAGLTLADGQNTIAVIATDYAGNAGTANATVTLDTTPPTVTNSAPSQAAAGSNISISSSAADNVGLNVCEVLVNNVTVWSSNMNSQASASNTVSYTFSPDIAQGTSVEVQSRCTDTAGNSGTAKAQVTISTGPSGPGYIQGQIYTDAKGLRLEGALANIYDSTGQSITQITTQADGNYFYQASAGDYILILGKDGYTSVERSLHVRPEKNSVALDARLTPVSTLQNIIETTGGTAKAINDSSSASASVIELNIPSSALTQQTDIRITKISNQGLAGALPAGWSPIAAMDIRVAGTTGQGTTFAQPAVLTVPLANAINFAASATVTLVSYDNVSHQWIVRGSGTVASDNASVTAAVPDTNQYALVVPDNGLVPQTFTTGQALPAFSVSSLTDGITAAGQVIPPAAPPSTGLKAVGEVIVSPSGSSPLYSGLTVKGRVAERFDLFSGTTVVPSDYTQDITLYRYPCVTNVKGISSSSDGSSTLNSELGVANTGKVGAGFPVTPSQEFTIIDLLAGKVSVEINLPATETSGVIVGASGARIADAEGNVLMIAQNAMAQSAPVNMTSIPAAQVTGIAGSDLTLLKALEINFNNQTLAQTAELSIAAPSGLDSALPVIIARQIDVGGASKLKLVALAQVNGSLITSVSLPDGTGTSSTGILTSGRYYFLQTKEPLGFVKGQVTGAGAVAYPNALVTTDTCSLVDLTGADGNYLVASTISGYTAKAVDITRYDEGTETGLITAAGQTATTNITVYITPPSVVSVTYTDTGNGIEPNTSITITFREPLDKTTVTSDNIVLTDASGNIITCTYSMNAAGNIVTVYPGSLLASQATYTLTISKNIKDLQGYMMSADVVKQFTVRDTTPPVQPAAGSITGTFPDASGYVTITATQGSADPAYTVLIINESTGTTVSVKPATNGSFTGRIQAMLGDDIRILMMDNSGNTTQISYIAFKNDVGEYLVTAKGGTVEGDSGTKLVIPEGALPGPTIVKITPITQDALSHPVPSEAQFLTAVNVDTGGVAFQKPVVISVPAPSGMANVTDLQRPFIVQPQTLENADGTTEKVYYIGDSATVANGRLTTACEPFNGVLGGGDWGFIWPYQNVMIVSGKTYIDMDGVEQPLKNAIIRSTYSWAFISRSDENGHYALFAPIVSNVPGYTDNTWGLTAINPYTAYRWNSGDRFYYYDQCVNACNVVSNLNIKLGDKSSVTLDKTAPSISMDKSVVSGQTGSPQLVAGTVPVGTDMKFNIKITDQLMGTATFSIAYTSTDGKSTQTYLAQLSDGGTKTSSTSDANGQSTTSTVYTYTPVFNAPVMGTLSQYFKPDKTGTYIFTVDATDAAGNKNSSNTTLAAVASGDIPASYDGPPTVTEILPVNGATDLAVSSVVNVYFSEIVDASTLNEKTFYLVDTQTGANIPATIYTGISGGKMTATLMPGTNLSFGRKYKIVLSRAITDNAINSSCVPDPAYPNQELPEPCADNYRMKLTQEKVATPPAAYEYSFKTKVPQDYDVQDFDSATDVGGTDIALYTTQNGTNTYAYVTAGQDGWRVIDVTEPASPSVISAKNQSGDNLSWRFTGVAVEPSTGILAMTEWITWHGEFGNNFGYVRFYDLASNPKEPPKVGQTRLGENLSGVPMRLAILGNYAYVSTIGVGLQIVDVNASKTTGDDKSAVVGVFDTINASCGSAPTDTCGQPLDVVAYRGGYVLMTTMNGYLLLIDVSMPLAPTLAGKKYLGNNSRRVGATANYSFTNGNKIQIMDFAISGDTVGGLLNVIDITTPSNPALISTVKDASGNVVNGIVPTDVFIDKAARLAYVTSGTILYVIDIKDPYNPILINSIGSATEKYADGSTVDLGQVKAIVEKNGWAYIANVETGMETLNLDPNTPQCQNKKECDCGSNPDEKDCCPKKDTQQEQCKVTHSSVNARMQEYNREAVDLSLKAPGGSVDVTRAYYGDAWHWGHTRHTLVFTRDASDAVKSISKGGVAYTLSSDAGVFTNSTSRISQAGSGWKWQNTSGSWKAFDADGNMTSYGDRTGITARLNYANGRLVSVYDRGNRQLFTYEYNGDNQLSAVTDIDNRRVEYAYTDKRLTSVKDALGNITSHTYDDSGRITGTTDAAGRTSYVKYDSSGKVSSNADGQGGVSAFVFNYETRTGLYHSRTQTGTGTIKDVWYDKDGDTVRVDLNGRTVKSIVKQDNVQIVTDEAGNRTQKEYDSNDNLIKVTYPDGATASYEYELTFNNVTKETDEKGIVTTYQYDSNGNQTQKVEAAGTASARTTTYTYDANGNMTSITTAADANTVAATVSMTYDSLGNMSAQTDAEGNTTTFTYDNRGNMLTRKDALNRTWSYAYDAANQLISATDPQNNTAQFTYDAVGNKIKEIDAAGNQKIYTYDQNNKLLNVNDAKGGVTTFVYDEDGRMTRQTDTEGKAVTYAYDTDGRLVSTTDGNGNTISNVYENASASSSSCSSCSGIGTGQPSKTVFPTFTRQYAYDTRGRKVSETDILTDTQTAVSYSYDTSGNLTSKTDKEGKATSYEYDSLRRLTKVTDSLGQTTTYTYDNRDNLTALTDAKGQTTTFVYDKNNRLISETRPMGQQTGYQYNATGLLVKKTDAKGQRIEYVYDNANRMAQIAQYNSTGSNVKNISFTYDSTGNLKTYSDGTTSATYTYDELYRKTQENINYGSFSLTTGYAYNKNGTKKSFTYPNGTTVNYTYDANNQLTGVNVPYAGNISYDAYQWTRPTGITLPSGSGAKQYAYDELMRTKTITSNDPNQNALMTYQYSYDKMDNIKTRNTQTGNYAYNYDNLYRLNEVKKDDTQTEGYTYDQVGNRTTSIATTGDWTYNSNNELLSYNNTANQYDANGNTIQRTINGQIQNFVYDIDNRLIEVRDSSSNTIAKYAYDPFGRRIKKQTGVNGQPLPSPLAGEGQGEGVITTYYLYSDEGLIGEYDSSGSQIKIYGYKPDSTWSTDPLFMREGGNIYFYHNDHLGTPQKMTNISGQTVWSATYDAFGKATVDAASTITSNLRFPGQYFDAETGWHYNWFRYYDLRTGRYMTEDPIGFGGNDINLYVYVLDNPIFDIDPYGLLNSKDALAHYKSKLGTPLRMAFSDINTSDVKPSQFKAIKNNLKRPCCDKKIQIDDRKAFTTSGDQALFLNDITLRLQGTLQTTKSCDWYFWGKLKSYDDLYDFNKANRVLWKEFLTLIGRNVPGTNYWIEIRGEKSITENGKY